MELPGFLGGTSKGRSDAVDTQETMNFYPEIPDNENGAKSNIVLIGTPGLKLFVSVDQV